MSIEKEITKIFEDILNSKNQLIEASDIYSNVDFKDNIVGKSQPSKDTINTNLLSDIQKAAANAGVKVDITTAISGHYSTPSRHPSGNAVDIALIDGQAVSYQTKPKVDKFVDELVKLGYVKNREVGNTKAVLTFGFKGHDNHVHVSNTSDISVGETGPENYSDSGEQTSEDGQLKKPAPKEKTFYNDEILNAVVKPYADRFKKPVTEEKIYGKFGNDISVEFKTLKLPKGSNEIIKSPITGLRKKLRTSLNCQNQLIIEHEVCGETFYLEYCGLKDIRPREDSSIKKGDVLGTADSDITINLYDSNMVPKNLKEYMKAENCLPKQKTSRNRFEKEKQYYKDDILSSLVKTVANPLQTINKILHPFDNKKIKEDIQRIKSLLK